MAKGKVWHFLEWKSSKAGVSLLFKDLQLREVTERVMVSFSQAESAVLGNTHKVYMYIRISY